MLPGLVQRCQLAHYLSVKRDASGLLAWLVVGRALKERQRKHEVEAGCRGLGVRRPLPFTVPQLAPNFSLLKKRTLERET